MWESLEEWRVLKDGKSRVDNNSGKMSHTALQKQK